jgi:hypothetical protein
MDWRSTCKSEACTAPAVEGSENHPVFLCEFQPKPIEQLVAGWSQNRGDCRQCTATSTLRLEPLWLQCKFAGNVLIHVPRKDEFTVRVGAVAATYELRLPPQSEARYRIRAVCAWRPRDAQSSAPASGEEGHFVCYARLHDTERWALFDDGRVSHVSMAVRHNILAPATTTGAGRAAYKGYNDDFKLLSIFLYQRRQ